jgi:hypothetical protein
MTYRITIAPSGFAFNFTLVMPPTGDGPFPVIINGDGCWRYLTNGIIVDAVSRGYGVAYFNRLDMVPDIDSKRDSQLFLAYPDGDYGSLAAWAWGYHRVVDALLTLLKVDAARIGVVGHSRGGKASLLAGVTDQRISLVSANDSGSGGAGCHRFTDNGGEGLGDSLRVFPYWFSSRLNDYVGRESELPFDQHTVKALVAPRALLTTEARADIWASPQGTRLTHDAAKEVYCFLGAEGKIGIWYREGIHNHTQADWTALLDFADWQFFGKNQAQNFDMHP